MNQFVQDDANHCLHPFSNFSELNTKGALLIDRAEGIYIYDQSGKQYLDAMSGLWCINMGYSCQPLIDAATKQLETLPYYNLFFKTTHQPAAELAKLLSEVTPKGMNTVFFTGSGSECNDTVIRMVRYYWNGKGKTSKKTIISRKNAYHGSTIAGASLGGMSLMHKQTGCVVPDIVHIDQPYAFEECEGKDVEAFGLERAQQLEKMILELGEDNVAAFIAEPIQGAGGVIIPPESYWPEIQRICDKYEILLIADEVICGFGRTGEWFASDTFKIRPDFICMAKGITSGYLPLGGVMIRDEVAEVIKNLDSEFAHGFTYSGHPVACSVAIANIKEMQSQKIIDRLKEETIPYFSEKWKSLASHPLVGEARSKGMVAAIELVKNKSDNERFDSELEVGMLCRDNCIESGLIMRAVGDTMIISPPLITSTEEIDLLISKVKQALDLTQTSL
ncbi:aspartate aminotransferase family protein [Vibrio sp. RC27]